MFYGYGPKIYMSSEIHQSKCVSHQFPGSLVCICVCWLSCIPATLHQSWARGNKGAWWQHMQDDCENVCILPGSPLQ